MNLDKLDEPFELEKEQVEFYKKNAFIKIKEVIPPEIIAYFNTIISDKVAELSKVDVPINERDTYGKAFLQLFNLWTEDEKIKQLIFSRRLAKLATDLMQVEGVRIYHDQALFKEGGGGITPWHADQYYWPLSSDKTITAWIPLHKIPLEMGPLEFSGGSHKIKIGRELSISDESEKVIRKNLRINNLPHVIEPFNIGEISFHSGWVFHRAGANITNNTRKVMTTIYMDKNIILKQPENDGQKNDWETWCPGVEVGKIVNSPLNPILYEKPLAVVNV